MNQFDFEQIVPNFQFLGEFLGIQPFGHGHINDTYAVSFRQQDDQEKRYILQRINHQVFSSPQKLMTNFEQVTRHLRQKIEEAGGNPDRGTITLVPTHDGRALYSSDEGHYWRAQLMIEGAQSYQTARDQEHYYSAAKAFGTFLRLLGDFPSDRLHVTIPDFHHTGKRFKAFVQAVEQDSANRAQAARREIEFVLARADEATMLVDMVTQGQMPERVTHNDTKFDNVMIDDETGEGICVIDLDTVMPGLVVLDYGDLVRSAANPGGEEAREQETVRIDLAIFDRLTHGYLDATRDFLTTAEIDNMAFGSKLITYEQGLRFLTDYLQGDPYYKIHHQHHNLYRSRTQFWMVRDMEMKYEQMLRIVEKYR